MKETQLELLRESRRKVRRIIFDCYHAKVGADSRVRCEMGRSLNQGRGNSSSDGSVNIESVMTGHSCSACVSCRNYEGN